jgi:hypothetical protein
MQQHDYSLESARIYPQQRLKIDSADAFRDVGHMHFSEPSGQLPGQTRKILVLSVSIGNTSAKSWLLQTVYKPPRNQ